MMVPNGWGPLSRQMSTAAATVGSAGAIVPPASGSVGPFSEVHASSATVAQADSTVVVRIADLLQPTRERTQVIGERREGCAAHLQARPRARYNVVCSRGQRVPGY